MDISFSEAKGMFGTAIDLMKKGSQLEAQAQIQKLQEQYLELHAENLELKQKLLELNNKSELNKNMKFKEPFFYLIEGDSEVGPFCPRCWQKDNNQVRVVSTPDSHNHSQQCQVCGMGFGKGKAIPVPKTTSYWNDR
jgi:hypothetical protein